MTGALCPYADCALDALGEGRAASGCSCAWKRPTVRCSCGTANRTLARFCRGCRSRLTAESFPGRGLCAEPAKQISLAGKFRQPPVVAGSLIYALRLDGVLLEFSGQGGARVREAGEVKLESAGFNRGAILDLQGTNRGSVKGWTYIAASLGGIEAVNLATSQSSVLYRAPVGKPVLVNGSEDEALKMRGMAAGENDVVFLSRSGAEQCSLLRIQPGADRPAELVLSLEGREVAGPVVSGRVAAFCTDRQAGVGGRSCGVHRADFPAWFEPFLSLKDTDLNLPPGGLPIVLTGNSSPYLLIAGESGGRSGLLSLYFDGRAPQFRPLEPGSSLNAEAGGTACLSSAGRIEVFRGGESVHFDARLLPKMPATAAGPWTVWLEDSVGRGAYGVKAKGPQTLSLTFENAECDWSSCFGALFTSDSLLLGMLNPSLRGRGELQFASWLLEECIQVA